MSGLALPPPPLPTPQLADNPSPLGLTFSTCQARGLDRWVPRSLQPHGMALGQTRPVVPWGSGDHKLLTIGWLAS